MDLYIDYGEGSRLYSLSDGSIYEARLITTRFNTRALRIGIQLSPNERLSSDLAISFHPLLGMRLTGTAKFFDSSELVREGLFVMEFSKGNAVSGTEL